ncbi:MAG: hypothetical protein AAGE37_06435 [Pseudomonadota bacterium]
MSLFSVVAYLFLSFLVSAWIVRLSAQNQLTKTIRKNLFLFPIVPVLVVVAGAGYMLGHVCKSVKNALLRAFEILSGRKLRRRKRIYFF